MAYFSPETWLLPDGQYTKDRDASFLVWENLGKFISKEILGEGWHLSGFNPSLLFGNNAGGSVEMKAWVALAIQKRIEACPSSK